MDIGDWPGTALFVRVEETATGARASAPRAPSAVRRLEVPCPRSTRTRPSCRRLPCASTRCGAGSSRIAGPVRMTPMGCPLQMSIPSRTVHVSGFVFTLTQPVRSLPLNKSRYCRNSSARGAPRAASSRTRAQIPTRACLNMGGSITPIAEKDLVAAQTRTGDERQKGQRAEFRGERRDAAAALTDFRARASARALRGQRRRRSGGDKPATRE